MATLATGHPVPPVVNGSRPTAVTIPRLAVILVAAYIAAQMLADIASLKIGIIATLSVDMGTFIYPITFTLRDLVHKLLGKRNAQTLVVTAGVMNLGMSGYLAWTATVPGDPAWGLATAYSSILGPIWRIVIASILAEVVSELIDTEIYHWFVTRITRRYQWARVLLSNSLSVPIDNLIFSVGAFGALPFLQNHFLTLPWAVVGQIFLVNLLVKYAVTILSLPFIYLSPDNLAD